MPDAAYSWYQLHRARAARPGVCFVCGPQPGRAVSWLPETGARICDQHNSIETQRALAALKAADRELQDPGRGSARRDLAGIGVVRKGRVR